MTVTAEKIRELLMTPEEAAELDAPGNTDAADFPTTSNAFIKSVGAGCHPHGCFSPAFVTKFSVDGKTLLYSTYLYNTNGLEDEEEVDANGIAVNAAGIPPARISFPHAPAAATGTVAAFPP